MSSRRLEEDQREGSLVNVLPGRRSAGGKEHAAAAVDDGHGERGKTGRALDRLQPPDHERGEEFPAQLLGVDAQGDETGQPVARGEPESQLRLKIRAAAVDHGLEHGDGVLLGRELAEALDDHRGFGPIRGKGVMLAIVRQHLVSMILRLVRPHVIATDERLGRQPLLDRRRDQRQVEGLGLRLRDAEQDVDVRRLQDVLQALRDTVRGLLAQLPQHDGGRAAEVGDRTELEVEQHRHGNGDGDGEPRRQPQAAIAQQLPDD